MKEKSKFFGFFLMIFGFVFALIFCFDFSSYNKTYATTSSPDITRANYAEYDFDQSLFEVILAMAKQLNCNQALIGRGFDVDLFLKAKNPSYAPTYIQTGVGNYDYDENVAARNQIVNDLNIGFLDLSTGENAKYDCLKNINPIKNIRGLNSLSLSFVTKLSLNDNEIDEITLNDFENLTNLQELSAENNKISKFEPNSNMQNLGDLNLSGNLISKISLANLTNNANVDLSNNAIGSIDDILFSTDTNKKILNLNLDFNLLEDVTLSKISEIKQRVQGVFNFGVQGLSAFGDITAGNSISIFNIEGNYLNNVSIKISYFGGNAVISKSAFYVDGEDNLICSTLGNTEIEEIYLPAGRIVLDFYTNGVLVDDEVYPEYASKILNVKLPKIEYSIFADGIKTDKTYQEKDFDVRFYVKNNANIPNIEDVLENSKIYVSVGDEAFFNRDSFTVTRNGTFDCSAYAVFDGVKSENLTFSVTRKYVAGIVMGVVIIIAMVVLIGTGYFVVRWYRSGAMVAPLSERELAALNRRKAKREQEVRDVFVKGSGKSRYFAKRENDEDVLTNLNSKEVINAHYNFSETGDYNEENYTKQYISVTNNYDRYNKEEFKNDFDENDEINNYSSLNDDDGEIDENGNDVRW